MEVRALVDTDTHRPFGIDSAPPSHALFFGNQYNRQTDPIPFEGHTLWVGHSKPIYKTHSHAGPGTTPPVDRRDKPQQNSTSASSHATSYNYGIHTNAGGMEPKTASTFPPTPAQSFSASANAYNCSHNAAPHHGYTPNPPAPLSTPSTSASSSSPATPSDDLHRGLKEVREELAQLQGEVRLGYATLNRSLTQSLMAEISALRREHDQKSASLATLRTTVDSLQAELRARDREIDQLKCAFHEMLQERGVDGAAFHGKKRGRGSITESSPPDLMHKDANGSVDGEISLPPTKRQRTLADNGPRDVDTTTRDSACEVLAKLGKSLPAEATVMDNAGMALSTSYSAASDLQGWMDRHANGHSAGPSSMSTPNLPGMVAHNTASTLMTSAEEYVVRFAALLGLPPKIGEAASHVCKAAERLGIMRKNRLNSSLAAAAIYMVANRMRSQSEIAAKTKVSRITIRHTYRELKPYQMQLLPEHLRGIASTESSSPISSKSDGRQQRLSDSSEEDEAEERRTMTLLLNMAPHTNEASSRGPSPRLDQARQTEDPHD